MESNVVRFAETLTNEYVYLFEHDPSYGHAAKETTPEELAWKMTGGFINGTANKEGPGIRRTCKVLGIAHTYGAIRIFLHAD